jgi:hypothetical protein
LINGYRNANPFFVSGCDQIPTLLIKKSRTKQIPLATGRSRPPNAAWAKLARRSIVVQTASQLDEEAAEPWPASRGRIWRRSCDQEPARLSPPHAGPQGTGRFDLRSAENCCALDGRRGQAIRSNENGARLPIKTPPSSRLPNSERTPDGVATRPWPAIFFVADTDRLR